MADYKSGVSRGLHGKEKDIKKGNKNEVSHTSPACHVGGRYPRAVVLSREHWKLERYINRNVNTCGARGERCEES